MGFSILKNNLSDRHVLSTCFFELEVFSILKSNFVRSYCQADVVYKLVFEIKNNLLGQHAMSICFWKLKFNYQKRNIKFGIQRIRDQKTETTDSQSRDRKIRCVEQRNIDVDSKSPKLQKIVNFRTTNIFLICSSLKNLHKCWLDMVGRLSFYP